MRFLVVACLLALGADPAAAAGRKKCSDFRSYAEAKSFCESLRATSPTCKGLDRDKDGSACESLPGGPKAGKKRPGGAALTR